LIRGDGIVRAFNANQFKMNFTKLVRKKDQKLLLAEVLLVNIRRHKPDLILPENVRLRCG